MWLPGFPIWQEESKKFFTHVSVQNHSKVIVLWQKVDYTDFRLTIVKINNIFPKIFKITIQQNL